SRDLVFAALAASHFPGWNAGVLAGPSSADLRAAASATAAWALASEHPSQPVSGTGALEDNDAQAMFNDGLLPETGAGPAVGVPATDPSGASVREQGPAPGGLDLANGIHAPQPVPTMLVQGPVSCIPDGTRSAAADTAARRHLS